MPVHDGETALRVLLEGNDRFVNGVSRHDHESPARRLQVVEGQHPFAVVLGCADSRVPPELLFDTGLGDLFVIRVAGNVCGLDELGSIEYGMAHLHTHLLMVLGHESCGAVTAVVDPPEGEEPEELEHLLHAVGEAVGDVDASLPRDERVHAGVEANVRHQVKQLVEIRDRVQAWRPENERMLIVGAVYELDSGKVRVLEAR
jgi:carbonic anhydrase